MGGVELGDQEGHVLLHAVGAGVREDESARRREGRLDVPRRLGVEGGEDQIGVEGVRRAGLDDHVAAARVGFRIEMPAAGVAIGLADGTFAGRYRDKLEVGVVREPAHEALAHDARRAEHGRAQLAPGALGRAHDRG
jgi:hypothetical protein